MLCRFALIYIFHTSPYRSRILFSRHHIGLRRPIKWIYIGRISGRARRLDACEFKSAVRHIGSRCVRVAFVASYRAFAPRAYVRNNQYPGGARSRQRYRENCVQCTDLSPELFRRLETPRMGCRAYMYIGPIELNAARRARRLGMVEIDSGENRRRAARPVKAPMPHRIHFLKNASRDEQTHFATFTPPFFFVLITGTRQIYANLDMNARRTSTRTRRNIADGRTYGATKQKMEDRLRAVDTNDRSPPPTPPHPQLTRHRSTNLTLKSPYECSLFFYLV